MLHYLTTFLYILSSSKCFKKKKKTSQKDKCFKKFIISSKFSHVVYKAATYIMLLETKM